MKKMNSIISIVVIVMLVFSGTSVFANDFIFDYKYGLEKYLNCKTDNDVIGNTRISDQANITSDEYIKLLLENNVKFEIKDIYYKETSSEQLEFKNSNDIVEIDGISYEKTNEVVIRNSLPLTMSDVKGDIRIRQINESTSREIDSINDMYENLAQVSILALVGYAHPVIGFITSLASTIPYSPEVYGWIVSKTTNFYYYTNVWHEVYDFVGYVPMVITESRRTNVKYAQDVTNKNTGETTGTSDFYQAVYYEYSMFYGKLTRNLEEAEARYNAGLKTPNIYRYYSGLVIDNTNILP